MSTLPGRIAAAIRFLTIFPLPGKLGITERELSGSLLFFPLVGVVIGLVCLMVAVVVRLLFPPYVAALLITCALAVCSGALHLDGLADTADGFFSSRPQEQMLEIMRDSATGVMGVLALVFVLLGKVVCLGSLGHGGLLTGAFFMPVAGRCAIVLLMAILPYARSQGGLASLFYSQNSRVAACCGWAFLLAASLFCGGVPGVTAALSVALLVLVFGWYCRYKIKGATGDTLGAVCELAEAVVAFIFVLFAGVGA